MLQDVNATVTFRSVVDRATAGCSGGAGGHESPPWLALVGWVALCWYIFVIIVSSIGYLQLQRHYSRVPRKSITSSSLPIQQVPHVTVIRPVKGIEPHLYECLASSLRQDYPQEKFSVSFCVSTRTDPAYPLLERLVKDFPFVNIEIFVEDDDPLLHPIDGQYYPLGPNPKIRNTSRAYREAKGDIVWMVDCNIWVGRGACGRMVDKLTGLGAEQGRLYKFVHHLPVAVAVDDSHPLLEERQGLLNGLNANESTPLRQLQPYNPEGDSPWSSFKANAGSRVEELFLSSSHAKMYSAINSVSVAPCVVGKSNMFRRSHLNYLTSTEPSHVPGRNPGIDFFSDNICEDHLIGDLLWKRQVPDEKQIGQLWGKHALLFGDLAIQPVADMSLRGYLARRVRWLRVRKFTVLLATLVEPGTEAFLCTLYLALGVTTAVPDYLQRHKDVCYPFLSSGAGFLAVWLLGIAFWILVDWTVYLRLHSGATIELDENTPPFARPLPKSSISRRPFLQWLLAWIGRESLALPIWVWAVYGGLTVVWRDKKFRAGFDLKVKEIGGDSDPKPVSSGIPPSSHGSKPTMISKHPSQQQGQHAYQQSQSAPETRN
ncbi:hypothetical protein FQN54_005345 [Arachnomyces sp. PD_36]|nr:hypothetical protein FQN54_005345 [Arachnomyces sp. PD_36]